MIFPMQLWPPLKLIVKAGTRHIRVCSPKSTCDAEQEKEADMSQLAEVARRQKACIAALQRERADLAARSADPAQVAALRAEAAALQRRLQELNVLKANAVSHSMTGIIPIGALKAERYLDLPGRSCL